MVFFHTRSKLDLRKISNFYSSFLFKTMHFLKFFILVFPRMSSKDFFKGYTFLILLSICFVTIHHRALPDYPTMWANFDFEHLFVGKQRLPSVIIIGAQKAGTRALIEFLRHHPSIAATKHEQDRFSSKTLFDPEDLTFEEYRRCMPLSTESQITLEKSPNYFASEAAPVRLFQYQEYLGKKIKLILTVVPPVNRSVSHFYHNFKKGRETDMNNLSVTITAPNSVYTRNSLYGRNLLRWLKFFTMDQILIVNGTALAKENPAFTLQKVEQFLELQTYLTPDHFIFSATKGFYCYKKIFQSCLGDSKGQKKHSKPLSHDDIATLGKIFTPDLELFYNLTLFRVPLFS